MCTDWRIGCLLSCPTKPMNQSALGSRRREEEWEFLPETSLSEESKVAAIGAAVAESCTSELELYSTTLANLHSRKLCIINTVSYVRIK